MSNQHLKDKVTLILGAAGKDNMGQVMARRFAKEGANLVLAGRNKDALIEISDEIGASYVLCDITKTDDIDSMVDEGVNAMVFYILPFKLRDGVIYHLF